MALGDAEIITVFGMRGCGKSTLTRKLSEIYKRRFVFDRIHEWNGEDANTSRKIFTDAQAFERSWSAFAERDHTLIFHFKPGSSPELLSDEFNRIARVLYLTGRAVAHPDPQVIVIEEAQFYCAPASIEPWLFEMIHTGRHANLAIIANAQRPATVHKSLVSQSHHIFIGQLFEARDIQYLRDTIGAIAEEARTLPKGEFIWIEMGNPPRRVKVF